MIAHTVLLKLSNVTSPIYIGKDLLASDILQKHIQQRVVIVTQRTIAEIYLQQIVNTLQGVDVDVCILEEGEENKTLTQWQVILEKLIEKFHDKKTTLIALGGGVVGDIAGFAAACYMRGIGCIQIPTTLIAQVDAAIGGKTAINFLKGKNLVGAFHQPISVICDVNFLKTLPEREYISGLAEVVKYGLIYDESFLAWIEANINKLLQRDDDALIETIYQSVKIKTKFVMQDEKELGIRSLLNFGHTFGHALEAASDYKLYLHGEAVAIGMLLATSLSREINGLSDEDVRRVEAVLTKLKLLPEKIFVNNSFPVQEIVNHMQHDKKNQNKKLNLILLKKIGEAVKTDAVENEYLLGFLGSPTVFNY